MTAFRIDRLPRKTGRPLCSNRCIGDLGTRNAEVYISIADHPFPGAPGARPGYFCARCALELQALWNSALTGETATTTDNRRCACGCGTVIRGRRAVYAPGHFKRGINTKPRPINSKPRKRQPAAT